MFYTKVKIQQSPLVWIFGPKFNFWRKFQIFSDIPFLCGVFCFPVLIWNHLQVSLILHLDYILFITSIFHASCILHDASCILHYASCIMHHASCIIHHALCIIHHVLCNMQKLVVIRIAQIDTWVAIAHNQFVSCNILHFDCCV